jgi:hypothetical protein
MEVDATGSDEPGQVANCLISQIKKTGVRLEL